MNTRIAILVGAVVVALGVSATLVVWSNVDAGAEEGEALEAARTATEQYRQVDAAVADGWALPPEGPLHECIEAHDAHGSMGFHYINGDHAGDTVLDPTRPAALVYEPTTDGELRLVAAEYVVFAQAWEAEHPDATPELFDRELTYVPEPNRYELPAFYQIHAWMWKDNPDGMFADFNTNVSCEHA